MSLRFLRPESLQETLALLAEYGPDAKLLAGGVALVLLLRQKLIAPQALISLARVPELAYERLEAGGLRLGPQVSLRQAAASPVVRARYPALAKACGEVGNVRVRNQATLGGNLAEADYASDPPAVLLALEARLEARSLTGSRSIPVAGFFHSFYTTTLEAEEMITEIYLPALPPGTRTTYLKFKSRSSEDRPCLGVAAVASYEDGICRDLRLAVGAACEVPRRLPEFEKLAHEEPLSDELIAEVAEGYAANIETLDDLRGSAWYRRQMIRVHARRALQAVRDGRG